MSSRSTSFKRPAAPRRRYPRKTTRKSAGVVALRKVNALVRTRSPEVKFVDNLLSNYDYWTGAGSLGPTSMFAIAQGNGTSNRDGDVINIKSVHARCTFTCLAGSNIRFRVLIVRDKQQVPDTTPAITDVLSVSTTGALPVYNTRARYQLIHDKVFSMNANFLNQDMSMTVDIKKSFPKGLKVQYNGSASTDIQKNGLYLFVIADVAMAGSVFNTPSVAGLAIGEVLSTINIRTLFTDL